MSKKRIAKKLLKYGESLDDWVRPIEGKRRFTLQRANSFLVGVLLDRQIDAERAWEAADWIVESIGNGEQDFWAATRKANKPNLEGFMRTAYAHGSGRESLPPDVEVEVRAGERVEYSLYVPCRRSHHMKQVPDSLLAFQHMFPDDDGNGGEKLVHGSGGIVSLRAEQNSAT